MPPCEDNFFFSSSRSVGDTRTNRGKKAKSENKPKDNEDVCVIDKNVPWMTTAVTDLSMQNFVPLDRAYCSENFLMISKFFAVGPSHFVTRDTFDDEEEWRDAILVVLFTRTEEVNAEEDLAVKDVWEIAKLILNAWWIVNACVCVYICDIYIRDNMRERYVFLSLRISERGVLSCLVLIHVGHFFLPASLLFSLLLSVSDKKVWFY